MLRHQSKEAVLKLLVLAYNESQGREGNRGKKFLRFISGYVYEINVIFTYIKIWCADWTISCLRAKSYWCQKWSFYENKLHNVKSTIIETDNKWNWDSYIIYITKDNSTVLISRYTGRKYLTYAQRFICPVFSYQY